MAHGALSPSFEPLQRLISQAWWAILLRGLAAVAFGVIAFAWPGISLLSLVFLYGLYALGDGVAALVAAFTSAKGSQRLWYVLGGVVSLAAGMIAFARPDLTGVTLVILIGAWSIVRGVTEIAAGIALRRIIANEWLLILGGVISILFGLALCAMPAAGALGLLWWIASWAILFGAILTAWAFRLRKLVH
ncbi:MAG TPA: DUF308 domain-containing protein [Phenylobacterium sp.]|nr:DUF308 domain-containing protein [Phenylobacterium sp.]